MDLDLTISFLIGGFIVLAVVVIWLVLALGRTAEELENVKAGYLFERWCKERTMRLYAQSKDSPRYTLAAYIASEKGKVIKMLKSYMTKTEWGEWSERMEEAWHDTNRKLLASNPKRDPETGRFVKREG